MKKRKRAENDDDEDYDPRPTKKRRKKRKKRSANETPPREVLKLILSKKPLRWWTVAQIDEEVETLSRNGVISSTPGEARPQRMRYYLNQLHLANKVHKKRSKYHFKRLLYAPTARFVSSEDENEEDFKKALKEHDSDKLLTLKRVVLRVLGEQDNPQAKWLTFKQILQIIQDLIDDGTIHVKFKVSDSTLIMKELLEEGKLSRKKDPTNGKRFVYRLKHTPEPVKRSAPPSPCNSILTDDSSDEDVEEEPVPRQHLHEQNKEIAQNEPEVMRDKPSFTTELTELLAQKIEERDRAVDLAQGLRHDLDQTNQRISFLDEKIEKIGQEIIECVKQSCPDPNAINDLKENDGPLFELY